MREDQSPIILLWDSGVLGQLAAPDDDDYDNCDDCVDFDDYNDYDDYVCLVSVPLLVIISL